VTKPEARDQALLVLYEAEQRTGTIDAHTVSAKARRVIEGILEHEAEIDTVVTRLSKRWTIDRMPVIDRVLLRLGIYELGFTDSPTGVVISEAVRLASSYSTDKSAAFINGVLAAYAAEVREGSDGAADGPEQPSAIPH
jgi:N utilization substance protein B